MEKTIKEMVLTAVNKAIENGSLSNKDNWDIEREILTVIRKEVQPVLDANDMHISIGMEKSTTIKIDGCHAFKIKRKVAKTRLYGSQMYDVVSVMVAPYADKFAEMTFAELKVKQEESNKSQEERQSAKEQAFVNALTASGLSGKEFLELMEKFEKTGFSYRREFEEGVK